MKNSTEIIAFILRIITVFCFTEKMTVRAWLVYAVCLLGAVGLLSALIFVGFCFGVSLLAQ